jgi:quercetin dioxygenase-like cupin family protein
MTGMRGTISIGTFTALTIAAGVCVAQAQGFKRTEVQRGNLSTPGRQVIQAVAEFEPGATSGRHTHPGEEIVYVLAGSVVIEIDGVASKTLSAGEGTIVPAGKIHNARNTGMSSARVLATYVVETGKPVTTPAS